MKTEVTAILTFRHTGMWVAGVRNHRIVGPSMVSMPSEPGLVYWDINGIEVHRERR